ncbi:MAG: M50 family metallopeptidase [Candidatus Eremiobacteraeota bacterium]|nr:M50 family metallopeptidase [Candidatus Eremiobacteraeota bacterium]
MMLAFALPTLVGIEKLLTFLFMLSVLVVLHELGHFILARRNGVRVNEFAVGFGPKLWKTTGKRSGTVYALNAFPIGGYCAMQGEDGKTSEAEQQRRARVAGVTRYEADNFQSKSVWQRLAIIVAGPFANFVLAFVILFLGSALFGEPTGKFQPVIGPLRDGMPAQKAGLAQGDQVVKVDNTKISTGEQLISIIHHSAGKNIALTYLRGGQTFTTHVTPVASPDVDGKTVGQIGFNAISSYRHIGVVSAASDSLRNFALLVHGTAQGLLALISHPRDHMDSLSGPVGIARAATRVEDFGWAPYFELAAAISLSLGFFNLLPIPALDGGRAAFIVAELVRGKPVDPEKEGLVHVAGFALLIMLILVVTYHDIANIMAGKGAL